MRASFWSPATSEFSFEYVEFEISEEHMCLISNKIVRNVGLIISRGLCKVWKFRELGCKTF